MRKSRSNLTVALLCLTILALTFSSCVCWPSDSSDDEDFFDKDTECDCGGLGDALYQECSGTIFVDGLEMNEGIFVQACFNALDQDTSEAEAYYCYIEAFCDADDCEEFARKLELCTARP